MVYSLPWSDGSYLAIKVREVRIAKEVKSSEWLVMFRLCFVFVMPGSCWALATNQQVVVYSFHCRGAFLKIAAFPNSKPWCSSTGENVHSIVWQCWRLAYKSQITYFCIKCPPFSIWALWKSHSQASFGCLFNPNLKMFHRVKKGKKGSGIQVKIGDGPANACICHWKGASERVSHLWW